MILLKNIYCINNNNSFIKRICVQLYCIKELFATRLQRQMNSKSYLSYQPIEGQSVDANRMAKRQKPNKNKAKEPAIT